MSSAGLPEGISEPLHPTGRPLTEFERQLLRVRLISHEAHMLLCGLTRTDDRKADLDLVLTLQNYALIIICRFLEIWAKFDALSKDNRRVREISTSVSFMVDRINEWPGLRDYRNWILAHKYQVHRNPEFIPPWVVLNTGRVPSKAPELMVLLDCVKNIGFAVAAYYGDIYRELKPVLIPPPETESSHGVQTGEEAQEERTRIAIEAEKALQPFQLMRDESLVREFTCDPPSA